jgi:hypothetical protein
VWFIVSKQISSNAEKIFNDGEMFYPETEEQQGKVIIT